MATEQRRLVERTRQGHLGYVDGIRALAALYVVVDHAQRQIVPWEKGTPIPASVRPITGATASAEFAVALFIVVSGFCLTLPVIRDGGVLRGGFLGFMKRRARRILPPFYLAALLSVVLIWTAIGSKTGSHWDLSIPVTWGAALANVFMLQDLFDFGRINHAFWSVALEWQIYLLFPILLLAWRRFGKLRGSLAMLGLTAALYVIANGAPAYGGFDPSGFGAEYLGFFILGCVAATAAFSDRPIWQRVRTLPWATFALVGLAITAAGVHEGFSVGKRSVLLDVPMGLFAFSLLVAGARTEGRNPVRAVLGARWLAAIGVFSYSIYLIHAPLLQVETQYVLGPMHLGAAREYLLLLALGVPVIVLASYCFFLVCERPFMSARQKRASRGDFVDKAEGGIDLTPEPALGGAEAPL
jgi:peptidoglycan/LPS O-acetylase OafA/YrhL